MKPARSPWPVRPQRPAQSCGIYDFKSQEGRLRPIGERFDTDVGKLRPDEFGNYLAGYAAGYAAFKTGDWSYIGKTMAGGLCYGARDELQSSRVNLARYVDDRIGQLTMNYNGIISGLSDFLYDE